MNYAQIGLFIVFVFSVLSLGMGAYAVLDRERRSFCNKSLYLGEALLLGSIFLVGELLILALLGMYKGQYLWGVVILNFALVFWKEARRRFFSLFSGGFSVGPVAAIFIFLLLVFSFRNIYPLSDVDSHSTYLFIQKLWLSEGTCLIGNPGYDIRVFLPHFDAVPYGLGLSVFGNQTLFPQLINLFWRIIVLLLVFGYASYRLNGYYGLAAAALVVFDDHFFVSGANSSVVINGAVIAFLFAGAYNLWEARRQDMALRLLLAGMFLAQLMANKYQMAYILFSLLLIGTLVQGRVLGTLKVIFSNKRWVFMLVLSVFIMILWPLKNFLATGDPFFPFFAGRLGIFNWTVRQEDVFLKVWGGAKPLTALKYLNYFFIWPGVDAAKLLVMVGTLLPLLLIIQDRARQTVTRDELQELFFWLSICVLAMLSTVIACFQDPRYYRYPIGIFSFAAVFSLRYFLKHCLNFKKELFMVIPILCFSFLGSRIIFKSSLGFPTIKENLATLSDKIHAQQVIEKFYPHIPLILKEFSRQMDKTDKSAWGAGEGVNFPQFLVPVRPVVSFWYSTIIKWDSYPDNDKIVKDLKNAQIEWVMTWDSRRLNFIPVQEYASTAQAFNRFPEKIYIDYGFPSELVNIHYGK